MKELIKEDARLDQFDKDEWRDVRRIIYHKFGRTWSEEEFEKAWEEFHEMKRRKTMQ